MAAAITQHICLICGIETLVQSAGTVAIPGKTMTPVASEVLLNHGISIEHKSRMLTREMLIDNDKVFVMEQKHLVFSREMVKSEYSNRIRLLDPPREIPDPLGEAREVYERLACLLVEKIYENIVHGKIPEY